MSGFYACVIIGPAHSSLTEVVINLSLHHVSLHGHVCVAENEDWTRVRGQNSRWYNTAQIPRVNDSRHKHRFFLFIVYKDIEINNL